MSFVRSAADVEEVQARLAALGAETVGIVLKIETVAGFEQLPEMLLAAMRSERVGVMIARGDLAVEAGYERLAEVQEEILWLCEAAHVPVIWATQVLDQLARTGRPSRAEVTDAALAARAECIMLNKGPHILTAIATSARHQSSDARSPAQEAVVAAALAGVGPGSRAVKRCVVRKPLSTTAGADREDPRP